MTPPENAAVHAFTNMDGSKVTMTAKRSGPPGMRLTPVVTIRIESPDGDFSEMTVPAVAASAFARVLDSAARYPRPKATPGYGPIR